jgi:hypothetical protein
MKYNLSQGKFSHALKLPFVFTSILLFIFLAGCCKKNDPAAAREKIMAADRYYSQLSSEKGMNAAFLAMFDSTGVILQKNHMPVEGLKNIRVLLMAEEDTSFILTWEPVKAEVSQSMELGYTYGLYEIKSRATKTKIGEGTYATVWKKNAGNEWKAVLDTGNPGLHEPGKTDK